MSGTAAEQKQNSQDRQVIELLTDLHTSVGKLHTKLFGDEDTETIHGRIPRIEAKQKEDNTRIKRLERLSFLLIGGGAVIYVLIEKGLALK